MTMLAAITIDASDIVAAATKCQCAFGGDFTTRDYEVAVERWLRQRIERLLADADWYAERDTKFEVVNVCDLCESAALPGDIFCSYHRAREDKLE